MDFSLPPNAEAFAKEVREFVTEHVTEEVVKRSLETGTMHDWGLHQALAARGWLAPMWPADEGGRNLSEIEGMVLLDHLHRAGAPLDGWITTMCGASAIRTLGTDEQRANVVAKVVAGEALIALGFSEPDSGSDVASARTKAIRDEDGWVINGQKMFTLGQILTLQSTKGSRCSLCRSTHRASSLIRSTLSAGSAPTSHFTPMFAYRTPPLSAM
jgi:alkylation response protein AidB-like acyl-CoA dehydrogenase